MLDFGIVPFTNLKHRNGNGRLAEDPEQTSLAGRKISEFLQLHGQITFREIDRLALLSLKRQVIDSDPPRLLPVAESGHAFRSGI